MPAPHISSDGIDLSTPQPEEEESEFVEIDLDGIVRVLKQVRANTEDLYVQGLVDGVLCILD